MASLPPHIVEFLKPIFEGQFDFDKIEIRKRLPWYVRWFSSPGAITLGMTIYFKENEYDMSSISGVKLLGHELYHVCQHDGNAFWYLSYVAKAIISGYRNHPYEKPAYEFGDKFEEAMHRVAAKSGISNPFLSTTSVHPRFVNRFNDYEAAELKKLLPE